MLVSGWHTVEVPALRSGEYNGSMEPFEYLQPKSISEAVALLASSAINAQIISTGLDLLGEMKEGTASPVRLVSLIGVPGLDGITENPDGLTIGAMTTITALEHHPLIRAGYTALAEASERLATPQLRNAGTLAGNLCQRPRCWYYRNPLTPCLKRGGKRCYAIEGHSKYLCVTGGDRCYVVHPSDTAVPLTAFGASITIAGPAGSRTIPLEEFFKGPEVDASRENVLRPEELVTAVTLPAPRQGSKSIFLKMQERVAGGFALASVAAILVVSDTTISHASIILGGVAPVPLRATEVEDYLVGKTLSEADPAQAGYLALPDPTPMKDNAYKITLARNLVIRAIGRLLRT